ncbi:MAG: hypothetical protein J7L98_04835, partial [Candidatus Verstraetearchaeota archaeon]|nr:hypothetical protein [Candidatus Verstraetearchaeota archaeon]
MKTKTAAILLTAMFILSIFAFAQPAMAIQKVTRFAVFPTEISSGTSVVVQYNITTSAATVEIYLDTNGLAKISANAKLLAERDVPATGNLVENLTLPIDASKGKYWIKIYDGESVVVSTKLKVVDAPKKIKVDPSEAKVGTNITMTITEFPEEFKPGTCFVQVYFDDWGAANNVTATVPAGTLNVTGSDSAKLWFILPNATYGKHTLLIYVFNATSKQYIYGTYTTVRVKPDISVNVTTSIACDSSVVVQVNGTGFPEGKIAANSTKLIVKDFKTGEVIGTFSTTHDEISVGSNGVFTGLNFTVKATKYGYADLEIAVGDQTFKFTDVFVVSKDLGAGNFIAKVNATSGNVGDRVKVEVLGASPGGNVTVSLFPSTGTGPVPPKLIGWSLADANGYVSIVASIPNATAGKYRIQITDVADSYVKNVSTFKVVPEIVLNVTSASPGQKVSLYCTGMKYNTNFTVVYVGGKKAWSWAPTNVPATFWGPVVNSSGFWGPINFSVPYVSGGGKSVTVKVVSDNGKVEVTGSLKIKPIVTACYVLNATGKWNNTVTAIYPGDLVKLVSYGYLADEEVKLKIVNATSDKVVATVSANAGGKADKDGNVSAVFMLPKNLKPFGNYKFWLAGSTSTNEANWTMPVNISAPGAGAPPGKVWFALSPEGKITKTEYYVGDEITITGVGINASKVDIWINDSTTGTGVKKLASDVKVGKYGYFEYTGTIPEMPNGTYIIALVPVGISTPSAAAPPMQRLNFTVKPKPFFSVEAAAAGTSVDIAGKGFKANADYKVIWDGTVTLGTFTTDANGTFSGTIVVPAGAAPGMHTITIVDAASGTEITTVTFTVLGPLKIANLDIVPKTAYNGSTVTITLAVQDYFGNLVSGASVTGSIITPTGASVSLSFSEVQTGVYSATWTVPADAAEGTYTVTVSASKATAGTPTTGSISFTVQAKVLPPLK